MSNPLRFALPALAASIMAMGAAHAADWSDTSISYRYGTKFAEPFGANDIHKNILNFSHISGYSYGTNFLSVDLLMSDKSDPSTPAATSGAQEAYVVYRNTLDWGKISGKDLKSGFMRSYGATVGFDWNTKDDAGYNSKKRMLVAGPTIMLDVPGFLNVSLLALWESNAPQNEYKNTAVSRYTYKTHPMLNLAWGIPFNVGSVPLSFEGYADFIGSKGKDEFGGNTKAETNIDMQVMYDASNIFSAKKNTFKVGLEYQYWKNKFGNDYEGAAGPGAYAKTPMIRAEYHF